MKLWRAAAQAAMTVACFGLTLVWSGSVSAQGSRRPVPTAGSLQAVQTPEIAPHLSLHPELQLSLENATGKDKGFADQLIIGDVLLALGLFDRVELGGHLPVFFLDDAGSGALGDVNAQLKAQILGGTESTVNLALVVPTLIPAGDFSETDHIQIRPAVVLDVLRK